MIQVQIRPGGNEEEEIQGWGLAQPSLHDLGHNEACVGRQDLLQVREIWLSSEDTGAWGLDLGSSIPALLQRLTAQLGTAGHAMLRLGMTNPPYILQHLPAIAQARKLP